MSDQPDSTPTTNPDNDLESRMGELEQKLAKLTTIIGGFVEKTSASLQAANLGPSGTATRKGVTPRGNMPQNLVITRPGNREVEYDIVRDDDPQSQTKPAAPAVTKPVSSGSTDSRIQAAEITRRFGAVFGATAKVGMAQKEKNGPMMWRVSFPLADVRLENIPDALRELGFRAENGITDEQRDSLKFSTSSDRSELRAYISLDLMAKALNMPEPKLSSPAKS